MPAARRFDLAVECGVGIKALVIMHRRPFEPFGGGIVLPRAEEDLAKAECNLAGEIRDHAQSALPPGFVYLRDVDPSIAQDIRYASYNNFVGHPLSGYEAPECILRQEIAAALKRVQAQLAPDGLSLKVYDCYRPTRAVHGNFFPQQVSLFGLRPFLRPDPQISRRAARSCSQGWPSLCAGGKLRPEQATP